VWGTQEASLLPAYLPARLRRRGGVCRPKLLSLHASCTHSPGGGEHSIRGTGDGGGRLRQGRCWRWSALVRHASLLDTGVCPASFLRPSPTRARTFIPPLCCTHPGLQAGADHASHHKSTCQPFLHSVALTQGCKLVLTMPVTTSPHANHSSTLLHSPRATSWC